MFQERIPGCVMTSNITLPRIYPITDKMLSGLSHAEQIERLADGGATLIQLREKHSSPREFYVEALEAVRAAHRRNIKLIINDRADIAIAAGADGVHLGQDDLPPEKARILLGPGKIIGFSTHNLEQAMEADSMPVDYLAIGPVFQTSTKDNPDPVIGLDAVTLVSTRVSKPLVAIGGITLDRAQSVVRAGADCVAVISDLYSSGDLTGRTRQYLDILS